MLGESTVKTHNHQGSRPHSGSGAHSKAPCLYLMPNSVSRWRLGVYPTR